MTWETWIKPTSGSYNWTRILTLSSVGNTGSNFQLRFTAGTAAIASEGNLGGNFNGAYTLPSDVWSHLALTMTGTKMKIYVNGLAKDSVTITTLPAAFGSKNYCVVGTTITTDGAGDYKGAMDEMRFWSTARSRSEIIANMNYSVSPSAAGLVAYYKMDEAITTTTLTDASVNGNTATLTGFATTPIRGTSGLTGFNAFSYVWTPTAGLTPSNGLGATVTAAPASDITYYAAAIRTNFADGCSTYAAKPLTVLPAPAITSDAISTAACVNAAASFSVTATNASSYQWQLSTNSGGNWSNVPASTPYSGTTSPTLSISSADANMNGYQYRAVATGTCSPAATGAAAILSVTSSGAPTITISSNAGSTVCTGSSVTFSAVTTLGGSSPSIQWKVDGSNVFVGSSYTTSSLANGQVVSAELTSNSACASPLTATSNGLTMSIVSNGGIAASVSITSSIPTICPGNAVTFTATPTNAGTSPTYLWKINGGSTGITTTTYSPTTLAFGDIVTAEMTSGFTCATPRPATSNGISVQSAPPVPTVSVVSPTGTTSFCTGTQVFSATVSNGGASPTYIWKKNTVQVATTATYSAASLSAGDVITVTVTPSENCATGVTSSNFTVGNILQAPPTPAITSTAGASVCAGGNSTVLSSGVTAGPGNMVTFASTAVDANYIRLPNNINLAATTGFTWEAWMKPSGGDYWNRFLLFGSSAAGQTSFQLRFSDNTLQIASEGNLGGNIANSSATALTAGVWNHVALTMAGTSMKLYINGALVNTTTITALPASLGNKDYCLIGHTVFGDAARAYKGDMDEIRFWSVERTAAQIAASMNNTVASNSAGLYAYYKADDASGTSLTDATGITGAATLVGTATLGAGTLSSFNAYTFTWAPSSGLSATNTASVTATPTIATTYSVSVSNGSCSSSGSFALGVTPAPAITTQPVASAACVAGATSFSVVATNASGYVWQVSTNAGTNWNAVSNGGVYSGATGPALSITNATIGMNDYRYRVVASGCSPAATSNAVALTVTGSAAPTSTISSNFGSSVCPGTAVTFTAVNTLPGNSPAYSWQVNNVETATTAAFTTSSLVNGDQVKLVLTSSSECATTPTATSNVITMNVISGTLAASVSIVSSPSVVCPGVGTSFTATAVNGGTAPSFVWKVNGSQVATGSTYSTFSLTAGQVVTAEMTSDLSCAAPKPATSNSITVTTAPATPVVSVVSPTGTTTLCNGAQVFTASVTNGGASPAYSWKKNGSVVATTATYTAPSVAAADVITVTVTPAENCSAPATSADFTVLQLLQPPSVPTILSSAGNAVCTGTSTTLSVSGLTAGPGNMLNFRSYLSDSNFIKLPNGINMPATAGFTWEAWLKPKSGSYFWNRILTFSNNTSSGGNFQLRFNNNLPQIASEGGLGGNFTASAATALTSDAWNHVAVTMDGGSMKLYINGALVQTVISSGLPASLGSKDWCTIGRSTIGDGAAEYAGNMDEIRFWSVARTQDEIQAYMNISVATNSNGLYAYYRLDDAATSSTVLDATSNGNNATLTNWGSSKFLASTLTGFNNYTFTWSPSSGLSSTTGSSVTATPTINTNYSVSVSNGTCSASGSKTISVTPAPSISGQPAAYSVCTGSNATFSVTANNATSYQWQFSGNNGSSWTALTNSAPYSGTTTTTLTITNATLSLNGLLYRVVASGCSPAATSTGVALTVTGNAAPTVTASSNLGTSICPGAQVVFSATNTLGGDAPAYQWKKNGNNVASGSTYTTSSLADNDQITVVMTSSSTCATVPTATSNTITMNVVTGSITASVSIAANSENVCPATGTTFTATPVNGGDSPTVTWKVNGTPVATGLTYSTFTLTAGQVVTADMVSQFTCASPSPATSNSLTVSPAAATPSVTITSANGSSFCAGPNTFTANPVNGGSAPAYLWKKNGTTVGDNTASYTTTSLSSGDIFSVIMFSSNACAPSVTSPDFNASASVINGSPATPSISPATALICPGVGVNLSVLGLDSGAGNTVEMASSTVDSNYILLPTALSQAFTSGFTFEAWVKPDAGTLNYNRIFSIGSTPTAGNTFDLGFNGGSNQLRTQGNFDGNIAADATTALTLGVWNHLAFTMSGSQMKLYINGTLVQTKSCTNLPPNLGSKNFFVIGRTIAGDNAAAFKGRFDEIRLWNSARTLAQIQASMHINAAENDPALLAYYKMNQTSGTTLTDASGHNNTGTLVKFRANPWVSSGLTNFNAYTYSWSPAYALNRTNTASVTAAPTINTTYTLTVTNANGCAVTASRDVNVKTLPAISVQASDFTVCPGSTATFSVTATDATAYSWQLSTDNGSTWSAVSNAAGVYSGATTATLNVLNAATSFNAYQYRPVAAGCAPAATGNAAILTVDASPTPEVSITSNQGFAICTGNAVVFTAHPVVGGSAPVYAWTLNNAPVGSNSATYSNATLVNGDVVGVTMTGNAPCASAPTATASQTITVAGAGGLTPTVSISSDQATVCPGFAVTFTANSMYGGGTPAYQWRVNGVANGSSGSTFSSSSLQPNAVVSVVMTSSLSCASPATVASNTITVHAAAPEPSVSITSSTGSTAFCSGIAATLTANAVNGGSSPVSRSAACSASR